MPQSSKTLGPTGAEGFRVSGLHRAEGFRVLGLGLRVETSGCCDSGLKYRLLHSKLAQSSGHLRDAGQPLHPPNVLNWQGFR